MGPGIREMQKTVLGAPTITAKCEWVCALISSGRNFGELQENSVQGHRHQTDSLWSDSNADDYGTTGNSVTASDAGCHG